MDGRRAAVSLTIASVGASAQQVEEQRVAVHSENKCLRGGGAELGQIHRWDVSLSAVRTQESQKPIDPHAACTGTNPEMCRLSEVSRCSLHTRRKNNLWSGASGGSWGEGCQRADALEQAIIDLSTYGWGSQLSDASDTHACVRHIAAPSDALRASSQPTMIECRALRVLLPHYCMDVMLRYYYSPNPTLQQP